MFSSRHAIRWAKVPYASLFSYNRVLQSVFATPSHRPVLTREVAGSPPAHYTYGDLQRDVIAMADLLVRRKEALATARGAASLSWLQPSKPPHVRSIFAQGDRTPSCDVMHDEGFYTTCLMCSPGYVDLVSLLASWSLNQLVSPMSVSQRYDDELMYVLENSGCRCILGETKLLASKFPASYDPLRVHDAKDVDKVCSDAASHAATYKVDTVVDVERVLQELHIHKANVDLTHNKLQPELDETATTDEGSETQRPASLHTADDVVHRIRYEKEAATTHERARQAELHTSMHKARNAVPTSDAESEVLCYDTDELDRLNALFRHWHTTPTARPTPYDDCLMIYTSGTTARPKGAVHTHASVGNMVRVLQEAWHWSSDDCILSVLPVHHIHGLVNVHLCALASGAHCVTTPFDNAARIARRLTQGDITLFMAVPTIYTKLIAAIVKTFSPIEQTSFRQACGACVRLMVSGSAALPVPTLQQFRELSGHTLLERYGMTEIGMALSQPLHPVAERTPGTVGSPLPSVTAYVYTPTPNEATADQPQQRQQQSEGESTAAQDGQTQYAQVGALAIASDSLFDRYWNNAAGTRKELWVNAQGMRFFDTGDTVGVNYPHGRDAAGVYSILGRSSVDIIKSRGYKLSALEIEAELLARRDLFYEVAVVGCADETLGEAVVAVVALQPEVTARRQIVFDAQKTSHESPTLTQELRQVALEMIAPYKCPQRFIIVPEIPRNPTGKINKKNLKKVLHLP